MKGSVICILFSLCLCYYGVNGGGIFMSPLGRGSLYKYLGAASYASEIVADREDTQLNCGGKHTTGGDLSISCGVCGDPVTAATPRDHELGGKYALGYPTAVYNVSSVINVTVLIESQKNGGFFEFYLCPTRPATEVCFQSYPLPMAGSSIKRIQIQPKEEGQVSLQLQLPNGITCDTCAMRWTWVTAGEYRCDPTGLCGLGYWDQITYVNCADVMILSQGSSVPADFQYPDYTSLYASIDGGGQTGTSTAIATTTPSLTKEPLVGSSTTVSLTTTASSASGTTRFIPIITVPTGNPVTGTTEKPPVVTESLIGPIVPIIVSGGGGGAAAAGLGLSSLGAFSPFLPLAGLAGLGGFVFMNGRRMKQRAGYPDPLMFYGQQGPISYSAVPVLGGPMYLPSTQLVIEERRYKVPAKQQSYTSYGKSQNLHGYGTNNYGKNNYGNNNYGNMRQNYGYNTGNSYGK